MPDPAGQICAAEVMAALSLATDLGHGSEFEHALRSAVIAVRLAERLDVDRDTTAQAYYTSLCLNVGCTAEAHTGAVVFGEDFETLRPTWGRSSTGLHGSPLRG